jgi:hypothetical protein
MAERFEAEELDDDAIDYLRKAARREGSGMPGVFFDAKESRQWGPWLPAWAAVCGPIVLLLTFLLGWGSTGDPPGTAMFLTAGLLLGGWLILAAVRALIARGRTNYLGHFTYVDPLYIWKATGTGVWVTPIDLLVGANYLHHSNENGYYKNTTVEIALADRELTLTFNGEHKAERLVQFFEALCDDRTGDPAERGYSALESIDYDEDEEEEDGRRRVKSIPRPEKVRSSLGWLPLVLLPATGVAIFFFSLMLATASRDDAVFELVKNKQAPDLRYYLIDKRNSRHREEAQAKLRALMEPVAQRAAGQGDKALGAGLADVVRAVAGDGHPLITLRFPKQEKKPDTAAGYLSAAVIETLNRDVVKEITDRLSQHLGQQTADYAEVTEPPAMIELVPKVIPPEKGAPGHQVVQLEWMVTLQASPEAKKHTLTISSQMAQNAGDDYAPAVRGLYRQLPAAFTARLTQQK